MKRLSLVSLSAGLVLLAVIVSALSQDKSLTPALRIAATERNPWTHLRLNNEPGDFRFAIVSDRTGGHRSQIFSRAVEQMNLLQPEFVLSVGDLIEGQKEDEGRVSAEWREFQSYVNKLQMPFFYVPGNHDIANKHMRQMWKDRFGRSYYHFVYRQVLFLILDTEDPPLMADGHMGAEQVAYARKVLEENRDVRWTIVAFHRPIWRARELEKCGWLDVEKALAGRSYCVFAGHLHRYQKFVRNGQNYYQMATTGGASKLRGPQQGEFDHLVWVTMKKDGPVLANILLDKVYTEDLRLPITAEEGVLPSNRQRVHPVQGKVLFEGQPVREGRVVFYTFDKEKKRYTAPADGFLDADGAFVLTTYRADDGAPEGDYVITVTGDAQVPPRYGKTSTSDLKVTVKRGVNFFTLELKK